MNKRRKVLIDKALEYFLENGLAGLSLRPLSEKLGTSARMLVYHFGSKDGLIATVMGEVQVRMQQSFSLTAANSKGAGIMRSFWDWATDRDNARYLPLLFQVQILAIQHPDQYGRYLGKTSSSWLELIEGALPPGKGNRSIATLCAAVMDGLLLEYVSTGDHRRTTAALEFFNRLMRAGANAQVQIPGITRQKGGI